MNKNSRTKNSIINSIYASSNQIITILLSFAIRTVFIAKLSAEYLGVNGLFTNIISMLSLADLGIDIAIPYTLYKPLATDNREKIKALMKLYAKIYNVIGVVVLIIGISVTPFLKYIIQDMPNITEINYIYILFVINSALSYFFVYKKLLLDSDQKGYLASKIVMKITILKSIIEILILYMTNNYIAYLVTNILATVIQNILISNKCNKVYPYIKEKTNKKVSKKDIKELKKNTSALIIYRIGVVALNGTDSIIISKFLNIVMVGIYSNYVLITNSITAVISKIFDAITASIGNLVVTTNEKKSEDIFYKLQFLSFWLYAYFSICIIALINPFIKLWIGSEYILDNITTFVIGLNMFVLGMQGTVSSYRNAYGLFVQGKYRPIIMSIVNIVLSVILVQYIGILGVVLGTAISRVFVTGIYDPIVVYKYGFKKKPYKYFANYIKYLLCISILAVISQAIISTIKINNFIIWILAGVILSIFINIIIIILYRKNENFKFYKNNIKQIYINKIKKKKGET